jgi:hypothetical protein
MPIKMLMAFLRDMAPKRPIKNRASENTRIQERGIIFA